MLNREANSSSDSSSYEPPAAARSNHPILLHDAEHDKYLIQFLGFENKYAYRYMYPKTYAKKLQQLLDDLKKVRASYRCRFREANKKWRNFRTQAERQAFIKQYTKKVVEKYNDTELAFSGIS